MRHSAMPKREIRFFGTIIRTLADGGVIAQRADDRGRVTISARDAGSAGGLRIGDSVEFSLGAGGVATNVMPLRPMVLPKRKSETR